jgi:DNA-binding Xre family transcriptional regulator
MPTMSTSADLVIAIKKELKAVQMTYADLALELDMAESSVKRMLAKGDMPLSRIDAICRALKLDFAELEQMSSRYRLTEAECIQYLAKLDHIGIIELKPLNRYRLKLAKTFRWRPHGAVMNYFRENALLDYFAGGFNGEGEGLLLVHGSISKSLAPSFMERMQRVAQDFAQQHQADQKLADKDREGYTLLLAMRSWEFEAFEVLRR